MVAIWLRHQYVDALYILYMLRSLCASRHVLGENRLTSSVIHARHTGPLYSDSQLIDKMADLSDTAVVYQAEYWVGVLHRHTCIYIYVCCSYFDYREQAGDFQFERRQVVFPYWMRDSSQGLWNRISSRINADRQTDWAIEKQENTWPQKSIPTISEHSTYGTPLPFGFRDIHGYGDMHVYCCLCWCSGTDKRFSNRKENICLPLLNAGFEPGSLDTNLQQTECLLTKRLCCQGSNKNLNTIARSANIQPTWPHCRLVFAHGSVDMKYIYIYLYTNIYIIWRYYNIAIIFIQRQPNNAPECHTIMGSMPSDEL